MTCPIDRRSVLLASAAGAALWMTPQAFARQLVRTPRFTEGPFYPDRLPLDQDNDLLIIGKSTTRAVGTITHLTGRVIDINGRAVPQAIVEIWQTDARGSYLHTRGANGRRGRDRHFQGIGRATTDERGRFRFRTIKPTRYPGRTPHIHLLVKKGRRRLITTQLFVAGEPGNARDGLYRALRSREQRKLVTIPFSPIKTSRIGELSAHADIVVGWTPTERSMHRGSRG